MYKPQDHITQLAKYIINNLNKGYTVDSLRVALINQGYSKISVSNAIDLANKKLAEHAPIMKEKPKITYKILDQENNPVKIVSESNTGKFGFLKKIFKK